MKKSLLVFLALLGIQFISINAQAGHEFNVRFGNQFGILDRVRVEQLNGAAKRFVFLNPAGHLEFQIAGPWFVATTFQYILIRGENADRMNVYSPTAGVKMVSFEKSFDTGDFFDRTRWWLDVEAGPYYNQSHFNAVIPVGTQRSFGYNVAIGFDTFFHRHWATGFQIGMDHVLYQPDDYLFLSFGPNLTYRF